ncbi:glycosyltransferase [Enterococcus gallinarum]|uniref:glycosyltransferase n=1 Tax=Enterococcus gallinarum TaxID=1353 RepID=UPI003BF837F8
MNILHLLTSNKLGGAEKVAINIIEFSNKTNKCFYCSPSGDIENYLSLKNVDFIQFSKISYFELSKIIKSYKIDIIHAHDFKASILSSFFSNKCRIISHLHQSPNWIYKDNLKTIVYRNRTKHFNKIIVTSKEIKNSKLFTLGTLNQVKIIDNYVQIPKKIKDEKKVYDFLFLGRLENEKNPFLFLDFIEKFNKFFTCDAAICGDGSLKNILEKEVEERKLNIKFLGFNTDPFNIIVKSKFLVITSNYEGFSLAAIESMSQGVPIITRRIGGVTDLLQVNQGIVVKDFLSTEFIYELKNIIDSDYYSYSDNARKFSEQYTDETKWQTIVKEMYKYDKEV